MAVDTTPAVIKRPPRWDTSSWTTRARDSGPTPWAAGVAIFGIVLGLGASANDYFDWSYALVDALFALGTAIAISWAGVPAFGQGLYFAAGGYTAALLTKYDLPLVAILGAGAAVATTLAFLFARVAINFSFTSFAMLSLVVAQAGNQLIYTIKPLGGENGLYGITRPEIFGISLNKDAPFYWYCLGTLVVVVFACRWFYQSTTGRTIRATRDESPRAEALGAHVTRARITAFTLGGFICGVAGVLYAQLQSVVDPSMGNFLRSTVAVMMVVLGGLGSFFGAVVGGVVYRWIELYVTDYTLAPDLWLGVVFVAVVLATPVVRRALGALARRLRIGPARPTEVAE